MYWLLFLYDLCVLCIRIIYFVQHCISTITLCLFTVIITYLAEGIIATSVSGIVEVYPRRCSGSRGTWDMIDPVRGMNPEFHLIYITSVLASC